MANWAFGAGTSGGAANNAKVAFGGGINGVSQGVYEESSAQKAPLGASLEFDDGRKFRYVKATEAIGVGLLVGNDHSEGQLLAELDNQVTVATAGDREFSMQGAGSEFSTTAEFYAGAYIVFCDGTGAGQYYRIKDHSTASTDKITFHLYDKLVTAPDGTTDIMITGNPYGSVITAAGTVGVDTDSFAVGVTLRAITSAYYFWAQTRGICAVKFDGATATPHYGMELVLSNQHSGQVEAKATDGHQVVGYHVTSTGDNDTFISMFATMD